MSNYVFTDSDLGKFRLYAEAASIESLETALARIEYLEGAAHRMKTIITEQLLLRAINKPWDEMIGSCTHEERVERKLNTVRMILNDVYGKGKVDFVVRRKRQGKSAGIKRRQKQPAHKIPAIELLKGMKQRKPAKPPADMP